MPPVLTKNGDQLELALSGCRGSEFSDAKDKIKEVPGRRWDPKSKNWIVPADPQIADRILKTIRPEADEELLNWVRSSMSQQEESLTSPLPNDAKLQVPWGHRRCHWQPEYINDEEFTGALPYQRAAIDAMAREGRYLLCDDMGLGKTFEAITAVEEWVIRNVNPDGTLPEGPKLIVCPASVKGTWARELNRFLEDPTVVILEGTPAKRTEMLTKAIEDDAWVIVNWEQIRLTKQKIRTKNGGTKTVKVLKEPLFGTTEWLAVIADEIHRAKNRASQQTQGLWRIQGKVMFGLTGTPVMNSPDELWSLLAWLWPDEYHERGAAHSPGAQAYWAFYTDHVEFWEDHFGRKVVTGVRNPDALRFSLKKKLIRRTAELLNLKGKRRIYYDVPLNPGQQKLYDEATRAMWLLVQQEIAEGNKAALDFAKAAAEGGTVTDLLRIPNGAARLVRLQQIIENAALLGGSDDSANMDDFEQKFVDSRPNKWIVFCNYKDSCTLLADRLRSKHGAEVAIYNGDVTPADRTEIENRFQRGEIDVVVGTVEAMYQGITLTNGHLQHWLSRSFVPARNEQGEARQHRLGQQELVRVYIPQAVDTVATEKVAVANELKESIVKTIIPQDDIQEVRA